MSDNRRVFLLSNMTPAQKRALAVLVVAGGVGVGHKLRSMVRGAQAVQKQLTNEMTHGKPPGARRINKIAVNRQFLNRLITILKICMPSPLSKEALLVVVQGLLLVSRTLLTDLISRVEGWSGSSLIALQFESFGQSLMSFALMGIPAAVVNASLKFMQKQIEMAFQSRLTTHLLALHDGSGAAHGFDCLAHWIALCCAGMMNPDQRITEDVEKFCFSVSDLYAHTLKPLLDVILFTRSLSKNMGYRGQFGLYIYYMVVAYILKAMSPPMAQMTAMETALSGSFRAAHVRLVSHAEEIAFNDPPGGPAEQLILNQHLKRMLKYSRMSAFQRFIQQIADNFFVKYFATVTALLVYAAPVYFKDPALQGTQPSSPTTTLPACDQYAPS
ncbi:ABC transporter transmembrane region 2-domain-containing protein [Dunaliella salina]|uniref:ABC transporter transmembrane region 2-domain-containing protein n=1 Tax=Dunaliella salina TaxID=3046 RepID=A0ABQ7H7B3_DUNSA|nr:ABC transporter transmembrane region 2-domain-containing protein [Dunaliella salina]|eukprot:KAF5842745.1 ABC transporter transmembrane region 2-domain-containing protein [Dunaliella salina]